MTVPNLSGVSRELEVLFPYLSERAGKASSHAFGKTVKPVDSGEKKTGNIIESRYLHEIHKKSTGIYNYTPCSFSDPCSEEEQEMLDFGMSLINDSGQTHKMSIDSVHAGLDRLIKLQPKNLTTKL